MYNLHSMHTIFIYNLYKAFDQLYEKKWLFRTELTLYVQ